MSKIGFPGSGSMGLSCSKQAWLGGDCLRLPGFMQSCDKRSSGEQLENVRAPYTRRAVRTSGNWGCP